MKTYLSKLGDPRWREKRLEVIKARGGRCEDCGTSAKVLEVHHCVYLPMKEPWEHGDDELMCLCPACHIKRQKVEDISRIYLGRLLRLSGLLEVEGVAWDMAKAYAHLKLDRDWAEAFQ